MPDKRGSGKAAEKKPPTRPDEKGKPSAPTTTVPLDTPPLTPTHPAKKGRAPVPVEGDGDEQA